MSDFFNSIAYKNWETVQRLVVTSFLARLCVKRRLWANEHSLFHCTIRHFCEDLCIFYCWQRHKFAIKVLLCITQYFIYIQLTVACSSATHTECAIVFQLQQWLDEHNTMLHYIYIYIQGVTGGTDQTSGECSLGQTIPI